MIPNCVSANAYITSSSINAEGTTLGVRLSSPSCASATISYTVLDTTGADTYICELAQCASNVKDAEFLPVAFVTFVGNVAIAAICTPSSELLSVRAGIDLASQGVLASNRSAS